MPATSGLTGQTTERILLDEGALYRDWDPTDPENSGELISATRGGSTFTAEIEHRQIEVDGVRGEVKGMKRVIRHVASLETTFMEMNEQLLVDLTHGSSAELAESDFQEITPSNQVAIEDYVDNITLVAEVMNQDVIAAFMLKNALPNGEFTLETNDEDEGTLQVSFMSHYDADNVDDVPYRIYIPQAIANGGS